MPVTDWTYPSSLSAPRIRDSFTFARGCRFSSSASQDEGEQPKAAGRFESRFPLQDSPVSSRCCAQGLFRCDSPSSLGAAGVPFGAAKVEEAEVCFLFPECVRVCEPSAELGIGNSSCVFGRRSSIGVMSSPNGKPAAGDASHAPLAFGARGRVTLWHLLAPHGTTGPNQVFRIAPQYQRVTRFPEQPPKLGVPRLNRARITIPSTTYFSAA